MREPVPPGRRKVQLRPVPFPEGSGVSDAPDRITPKLAVDDKVFKPILQSLYFDHGSPYHFGVMPVEILGTVYERFLGKVIRLTEVLGFFWTVQLLILQGKGRTVRCQHGSSIAKSKPRRSYAEEFKQEAVQMLLDGHSAASVAERLGLPGPNLLYRWKREAIGQGGAGGTHPRRSRRPARRRTAARRART